MGGVCAICSNRGDENKLYLDFVKSLKIRNVKAEDLVKKIKEKYSTVSKEEKKKSILFSEIFPLIESSVPEFREFSHSYYEEYFETNKKDFFALILLCDKDSNFKKCFEEITNINRNEWLKYYSSDKTKIEKNFLKSIVNNYIKFSTSGVIPYIEKISGNKTSQTYLNNLFDNETRFSIVMDIFQPFEDNNNMVDVDAFFKSMSFKQKIISIDEILKTFLTYNSLKSDKTV